MYKYSIMFALIAGLALSTLCVIAQNTTTAPSSIEMADSLYQSGRIYVVVAVILTIFAGMISFLVYLDRKINRLEKN